MVRTETTTGATATRILDVAEELVQRRGFNGFSYADIASALGVTKAGLHYHYPSKADLGVHLIRRYSERFFERLAADSEGCKDVYSRLRAYAGLYSSALKDQRFCLCGMLAAEFDTLPEGMRDEVMRFFERNEEWLMRELAAGRERGEIAFEGAPEDLARVVFSALEGAMLIARPHRDSTRFQAAVEHLLATL